MATDILQQISSHSEKRSMHSNIFPSVSIGVHPWLVVFLICCVAFAFPTSLLATTNAPVIQGEGVCRFVLHDYQLTPANRASINLILSDLLTRHEQAFKFTTGTNRQLAIRIFGRFEDFRAYLTSNPDKFEEMPSNLNLSNVAGFYSAHDHEVVTWRQRDPTYFANNLLHECSHAIMNRQFRVVPTWLAEGVAEYFSYPKFMRDARDDRRLTARWLQLKQALDENSLPELRGFVNTTDHEFRALQPERSYAVSWSLVQFFESTPANQAILNNMLRVIQQGDPRTPPCADLLAKSYPGGLPKMEKDWHAWVARGAQSVQQTLQKSRGR
jgi:hypothetical protein